MEFRDIHWRSRDHSPGIIITEVIAESSMLLSPIVSYAQGLMSTPRGQGVNKSFPEH